MKKAQ